MLLDGFNLGKPLFLIHAEDLLHAFAADIKSAEIQCVNGGHVADGCFYSLAFSGYSLKDPFENTAVFSITGPDELIILILAEPVDIEYLWQLVRIGFLAHVEPMLEVIADMVPYEGKHGKWIAAHLTDLA